MQTQNSAPKNRSFSTASKNPRLQAGVSFCIIYVVETETSVTGCAVR